MTSLFRAPLLASGLGYSAILAAVPIDFMLDCDFFQASEKSMGLHIVTRMVERFQNTAGALRSLSVVYKMALLASSIMLVAVLLLGVVVTNFQMRLLTNQVDDFGNIIASQLAATITEPLFTDDVLAMQVQIHNLVQDPRIRAAVVYDADYKLVVEAGEFGSVTPLPQDKLEQSHIVVANAESTLKQQRLTVSSPVVFNGLTAGYVVVDFVPLGIREGFIGMLTLVSRIAVGMVLVMMLLAYVMSRRLSIPIKQLVDTTERIGAGEYSQSIALQGNDEFGRIAKAINRMSLGLLRKQQLEGVLNQLVASEVAEALLRLPAGQPVVSEDIEASVLFVDIVGFTALSEAHSPAVIVALLNEYFGYFTVCSQLFGGCVDKFIGDCAMILFGAPKADSDHQFKAMACAIAIQRLVNHLNEQRLMAGLEPVQVRIGINSGPMMAGTVGAPQRLEYTVVGNTVNIASRLTSLADPGKIFTLESVARNQQLQNRILWQSRGEFAIKGSRERVSVCEIIDVSGDSQRMISDLIDDLLARFKGVSSTHHD